MAHPAETRLSRNASRQKYLVSKNRSAEEEAFPEKIESAKMSFRNMHF